MTKRLRGSALALALLVLPLWLAAPAVAADDKSVAEEILDILKAEGRIDDQQYDALSRRAREEIAARELPPVSADSEWEGYWKDGITVENKSKGIKVRAGGRLMFDFADFDTDNDVVSGLNNLFGPSSADDLNGGSGTETRRARIFFDGTLWERMGFKLQLEFAGGDADLKDGWLQFREVPWVQQVKVGQFKEPFSLEELTSSKYITFMERSLLNAFAPSRNAGIGIGGPVLDQKMTWSVGAFRQTDDTGNSFTTDEIWNLTGRVTAVPLWEEEGARMVHVGVNYGYTHSGGDLRFRSRPEAHMSPVRFVDTSSFEADYANQVDVELAANLGPLSLQGEALWSFVNSDEGDDPDFFAYYAQASYFLTGEHRPYKRKSGTFSRVKPARNFSFDDGIGAWELAVRYSYINLNDGFVNGGRLGDITAGLNWYVNPNVRFMFNYVHADLKSGPRGLGSVAPNPSFDGNSDIFQARMQVDF